MEMFVVYIYEALKDEYIFTTAEQRNFLLSRYVQCNIHLLMRDISSMT